MELYKRIVEGAAKKGFTILDLSREVGMGYTTIMTTKHYQMKHVKLGKLCQFLDLDYDELVKLNDKLPTFKEFKEMKEKEKEEK